MTIAARLAQRIVGLRGATFPALAYEKAQLAILDTVGVTLAGSAHPALAKLARAVLEDDAGASTVLGTRRKARLLDAALLNGTAAHMLDFDDSNSQLFGHPSVAVLPALLALAERERASGRALLDAYLGGFETAARVGLGISRFQYTHGWHPTSSVGIFGAVAATSLLLGLDEERTATALCIATSMSAGVKSNFGSMTKPLHVGQAARNALQATLLAAEGFTANLDAFEHPQGYLEVYNNGPANYSVDAMLAGWNDPPCILDLGIKQKRFACCYACLAPIDGILALRERHGLRAEDIEALHVEVHPIRYPHINVPDPLGPLGAKFSVHFCVARALIEGTLRLEDFEGDAYRDPAVRALMGRVTFGTYAGDNPAGAVVRATTRAGAVHEIAIEKALGAGYDRPLPEAVVRAKFDDCAARALAPERAARLYETLVRLPALADVGELTSLAAA